MPYKIIYALICAFLPLYAHTVSVTNSLQKLHFTHSKQKKEGMRYILDLSYHVPKNSFRIAWEKSDTTTYKPPLPTNLHVDKYFLGYTYKLTQTDQLLFNYATIDDNLAKESDNGKVYAVGYKHKNFMIKQYFSNYHHFNVYQSDIAYRNKRTYALGTLHLQTIVKYIRIRQQKPNSFTRYALHNYLTPGFKLHLQKQNRYVEAGAFFGKRLFAVMNNGFSVQHHAMEFHRHFMIAGGIKTDKWQLKTAYTYLKADELPLQNKNVTVQSFMISISRNF